MTTERITPDDEQVEDRAAEIAAGKEDSDKVAEKDAKSAKRAAAAILEESEERMFDNATVDPDDDSVHRRKSEETK